MTSDDQPNLALDEDPFDWGGEPSETTPKSEKRTGIVIRIGGTKAKKDAGKVILQAARREARERRGRNA